MRNIAMLVGLTALLLMPAVGVAVAVDFKVKQCRDDPCRGTDQRDLMYEREGQVRDRILGLDGKDRLVASAFERDRDRLEGGPKADVLFTNDRDGRDTANGGRGSDRCVADRGNVVRSCKRIEPSSAEAAALLGEVRNASTSAGESEGATTGSP
jgi:hypothetical protein